MRTRKTSARRKRRSPEFAAWLAVTKGPVCERWRYFPAFYADIGKRPSWQHLVIRDDPSAEFSPTNARWRIARWLQRRRATA